MSGSGISRAMHRLPATRLRLQNRSGLLRIPTRLARTAGLHGAAVVAGRDGVETPVGRVRDERGALGLFLSKPPTDAALVASVPVVVAIPRYHATTSDGFIVSVEATCTAELYGPMSADQARDFIVSSVDAALTAETVEGRYEALATNKGTFSQRVLARMAFTADKNSSAIVIRNYAITALDLDPAGTLAIVATQEKDPDDHLVAAAAIELIRQIRNDRTGRRRMFEDSLQVSSKSVHRFANVYYANKPLPSLTQRGWIHGLFKLIIVSVLASMALYGYSSFSSEVFAAQVDDAIEAGANSFKYHATKGWRGETVVQRQLRLAAEAERRQEEEKRTEEIELDRLRREEERLKWSEERRRAEEAQDAWRRAHGLQPMTPLGRFVFHLDIFGRRSKR